MRVSVEKPGSPEDVLEHFGKKGMKWGHRKAKITSADIIGARVRSSQQQFKALAEKDPKKRANLQKAYLKNPDRATALRMTKGEKVTLGLIAGIFAVPTAGIVPAGIGIGVGVQRLQRRSAEKKAK